MAVEWFLKPDHLPILAGIQEGWFAREGVNVGVVVPDNLDEGLAEVEAGRIAFAGNEPRHRRDVPRSSRPLHLMMNRYHHFRAYRFVALKPAVIATMLDRFASSLQ